MRCWVAGQAFRGMRNADLAGCVQQCHTFGTTLLQSASLDQRSCNRTHGRIEQAGAYHAWWLTRARWKRKPPHNHFH